MRPPQSGPSQARLWAPATTCIEVATHQGGFSNGEDVRHKRFETPVPLDRGDELGIFHLGSTSIVVFERGRVILDPITSGTTTRMGRPMGRIVGQGRSAQVS